MSQQENTTDRVAKLIGKSVMLLEQNHNWPLTAMQLVVLGYTNGEIDETERYLRDLDFVKRFSKSPTKSTAKKMKTEINYKGFRDIEAALAFNQQITGHSFFECYENSKKGTIAVAENGRCGLWMVDEKTGGIYYSTICPDGLVVFNKLSLSACLNDSPFVRVKIVNNTITIDYEEKYPRTAESRKMLAAERITVTTGI